MRSSYIALICAIALLTQPGICWFQSYEEIMPFATIASSPSNIKSMSEIVEFDDFTFGLAYIASDDFAYAAFIRHGVLSTPVQVTTDPTIRQPKVCNYNDGTDEYMLIQSILGTGDANDKVVGRLLKKSDSSLKAQFDITPSVGVTGDFTGACQQVKDKIFISHQYTTNTKIDAYMNIYDPVANTLGAEKKVNNQVVGDQYGVKFTALLGDNQDKVMLAYRDKPNGIFMQLVDFSGIVEKRGQLIQNQNAVNFDIASMEDGGFVINYVDDNAGAPLGNGCWAYRFDKQLNQVCKVQVHPNINDLRSMFVYKDTIIFNFYKQSNPFNVLHIRYANIDTCVYGEQSDLYSTLTGTIINPSLQKSKGDGSYIIGVVTIGDDTNHKIMYGEYYLDQFEDCAQIGCSNCHTDVCPVCQGSTTENREIRTKTANVCTCKDGYYDDPTKFDCQKCSEQCATCSGTASNCDTCTTDLNTSPNRSTTAPACSCSTNYFDTYEEISTVLTLVCKQCDNMCQECQNIDTNCTLCKSDTRITPTCKCKIGYYEESPVVTACSQCNHACTTCTGDATSCDICSDANREGANCTCKQGYFNDGTDPICKKCDESCLTCSGTSTTCDSCKDNTTRFGPNCACKTGLYETGGGGKCIDYCSSRCDSCSGRFDNCSTCASTRSNSPAPACSLCDDGFYEQGEDPFQYCLMCSSSCKTCSNGSQCTECKTDDLLLPNCINTSIGYTTVVNDDGTTSDIKCDPKCKTCTSDSSQCGSCQGLNREKNCDCAVGFHDFEQTTINCIQCPTLCSSCIHPTHCTGCSGDHFELNDKNLCVCKAGYTNLGGTCIEECGNDKYWRNGKCNPCFYYQTDICMEECPSHATASGNKCEVNEISSTVVFIIIVICIVGVFLLAVVAKRVINNQRQNKYKSLKIVQNGNNNDLQNFQQSDQQGESVNQLNDSGDRSGDRDRVNSKESESIVN